MSLSNINSNLDQDKADFLLGAVRRAKENQKGRAKRKTPQPENRTLATKPKVNIGKESVLPKKPAFKLDKPAVAPGIEYAGT